MTFPERTALQGIVERALSEDLGPSGDITSTAIFGAAETAKAVIRSKSEGILSGVYLLEPIFSRTDPALVLDVKLDDGSPMGSGAVIAEVSGSVRGILSGERTALNFLQRLSGIATLTSRFVAAVANTSARILDTRKTTPGLRALEKKAVLDGGGANHRFGLFDMFLIKDTHVKRAGGVAAAIERALRSRTAGQMIEVEVQTEVEFATALRYGIDRIMLDNMSLDQMRDCVRLAREAGSKVQIEASGNMSIDRAAAVAHTGVDYISVGALTHSAPSLDIHLVIT